MRLNDPDANFRIVCPDEMVSNRLSAVFEATPRQFIWPTDPRDESVGDRGRVLEILSEHTCQGWLGYLLTGRHGLFPCYEAFVAIVDSMMAQYAKFLNKEPSRHALDGYLRGVPPFDELLITLFSHGVDSIGLVPIEGWRQVCQRATRVGGFIGVDERAFPRDFGVFVRYHFDFLRKIRARYPMPPVLTFGELNEFLRETGNQYRVQWVD